MTKPAFAFRFIVPMLIYASWVRLYLRLANPRFGADPLARPPTNRARTQLVCLMIVWSNALNNFMLVAGTALNCE